MQIAFATADIAAKPLAPTGACSLAFQPSGTVVLRLSSRTVSAVGLTDYQADLLPAQVAAWKLHELSRSNHPYVLVTLIRQSELTVSLSFDTSTDPVPVERRLDLAVGQVVRALRRASHLSPQKMAVLLGRPFPHVVDLETGRRTVWPHLLDGVASLFGVTPGQLLDQARQTPVSPDIPWPGIKPPGGERRPRRPFPPGRGQP
jgi:hypothetical protein